MDRSAPTGTSRKGSPGLAQADWLVRAETQAVFAAFAAGGFSARAVGGAVRNAMMGLAVKDIDLATTATPGESLALAKRAGLKAVGTGVAHGTVTVIAGHIPYEVTTLREDVETFGRHARVAFTSDWAADARRRDFTINAFYCDADGTVHDPLGGWPDLVARRVRFIGDAHARIREDYLRILRFFRFHAEYGRDGFDPGSLEACISERDGLSRLSAERVRLELLRLLAAPGAVGAIETMAEHDILSIVLGAAPDVAAFARLARIERALALPADPVLRLAALATKPEEASARPLSERLRLSSAETARLAAAGRSGRVVVPDAPEGAVKAAIYRLGSQLFCDAVLLDWARSGEAHDAPGRHRLIAIAAQWQPPALPVRGRDILALGVPPGPRVSRILEAFEAWWVAEGFPDEPGLVGAKLSELVAGS